MPFLVKHHQLFRRGHRELAQDDLVDQGENRRIRPDPERKRQDRDDGEERAAEQAADGQTEL